MKHDLAPSIDEKPDETDSNDDNFESRCWAAINRSPHMRSLSTGKRRLTLSPEYGHIFRVDLIINGTNTNLVNRAICWKDYEGQMQTAFVFGQSRDAVVPS